MVSLSLSLATFTLCSAALVNVHPHDDQIFTEYSLAGTTTVHVGAGSTGSVTTSPEYTSATTGTASNSTAAFTGLDIPADWVRLGVEVGAIHWANYRNTDVSHKDAVKIVREGIRLYVEQPAITKLINQGYKLAVDNWDSISAKNISIPEDFPLKAIKEFTDANEQFINSPGFTEVDSYIRTNIGKFDIGSIFSDVQNLIEINPAAAKDAFNKVHSKISESPQSTQAVKELFSLAVKYAKAYGIQTDVIQNGVASILPSLL